MLVVGALLFVRSLRNLTMLDPGSRRTESSSQASICAAPASSPEQLPSAFEQITRAPGRAAWRAGRRPGRSSCRSAAAGGTTTSSSTEQKQKEHPNFNAVSADYFRTLDTPVLLGRAFDDRIDHARAKKVAIVNESFVKKFFARSQSDRPGLSDRRGTRRAPAAL